MSGAPSILRLGTRGSLLARAQSRLVADELEKRHAGLRVELRIVQTSGDRITDRPLTDLGGKGLFTKEIEQALLRREIDFAVHSFKDVPVTMPLLDVSDLLIAAVPTREDPRDVLICPGTKRIEDLPPSAKVASSSLRRRCQVLAIRPDLQIEPVRGNIDTRLRKLREGQFDALILAAAGLRRTALFDETDMSLLELESMLPAPGQGALAVQCRRDDARTRELLAVLNDDPTSLCVRLERALVSALAGDCHSPIAALAEYSAQSVHFRAAVGARDGGLPLVRAESRAAPAEADRLVADVFKSLSDQGVQDLLSTGRKPE